jgi:hypothetical protein
VPRKGDVKREKDVKRKGRQEKGALREKVKRDGSQEKRAPTSF